MKYFYNFGDSVSGPMKIFMVWDFFTFVIDLHAY